MPVFSSTVVVRDAMDRAVVLEAMDKPDILAEIDAGIYNWKKLILIATESIKIRY